ncbi:unnamed protein product, partial [Brassica oleracea var. botrytis]
FFIERRRTDLPTEKAILPPENVETPEIDGRDDVGEKEASFERERKMLVFTVLLNSLEVADPEEEAVEYLLQVRDVLEGKSEMEKLLGLMLWQPV